MAGKAPGNAQTVKTGDYYREALSIMPLTTPVYPARALAAKAGMMVVGVRVTVDKDGRVSDVAPSLLAVSNPTKFDAEFQAAVRGSHSMAVQPGSNVSRGGGHRSGRRNLPAGDRSAKRGGGV